MKSAQSGSQRGQRDRARLGVEGATAVAEERGHHADVRSGEDVAGRLAVVLDRGADDGVGRLVGDEHLLELVEDDEHAGAELVVDAQREVQPLGQAVADRRQLRAGPDRPAGHRDRGLQAGAYAVEPARGPAGERLGVGALDAVGDVGEGQHSEEVHVDAGPALGAGLAQDPAQQGGLAVAAGGDQAGVVALSAVASRSSVSSSRSMRSSMPTGRA